jgi:predicted O-methyltransferase YrrM
MLNKLAHIEAHAKKWHVPILNKEKAIWLEEYLKKTNPKTVLEIGTAIGYSTLILAANQANVTTIERDHKSLSFAINYIKPFLESNEIKEMRFLHGDAREIIKDDPNKYDLIFLDFEARMYAGIFEELKKRINKDGVIITDNINNGKCDEFKKQLEKLNTQIIEIGDGLAVTRF